MNQGKAAVEVGTEAKDKATAEAKDVVKVWVAGTEETAVVLLVDQVKVLAEVETGVMDKVTAEVLVARNAKVAVKANAKKLEEVFL